MEEVIRNVNVSVTPYLIRDSGLPIDFSPILLFIFCLARFVPKRLKTGFVSLCP